MRTLGRITGALDWLAGWVILASMFLTAGFLFLSAWRLYLYALSIRASGEVAATTEVPFWPITLVVAGGLLIYGVVELAKAFHLIAWGEWRAGSGPMVLGSDYLPQNQEQEGEVR